MKKLTSDVSPIAHITNPIVRKHGYRCVMESVHNNVSKQPYTAAVVKKIINTAFEILVYLPIAIGIILSATFSLACAAESEFFITEDGDFSLTDSNHASPKHKVFYQRIQHKRFSTEDDDWLARSQLEPISESIPSGFASASLVGIYLQSCDTLAWHNIQDTPFALHPKQFSFNIRKNANKASSFHFTPHRYDHHIPANEISDFECEQANQLTSHVAIVVRLSQHVCQSPAYIEAIAQAQPLGIYRTGDKVQHQGTEYLCLESGWCTQGGEYAPAGGRFSAFTWKAIQSCSAR